MRTITEEDAKQLLRLFMDRFKDLDSVPATKLPTGVTNPERLSDLCKAFSVGWLTRDECEDPELDSTPFQSHSFTRGENFGVSEAIKGVEDILSGKDTGYAPSAPRHPSFERLRRDLIALKQRVDGPSLRRDGGG